MAAKFQLTADYAPAGDQPKAIEQLTKGFADGKKIQVLDPGQRPIAVSDPRRGGSAGLQGSQPSTPAAPGPDVFDEAPP